jgi:NAD(P)-dependent dehydrogenase (short-subunit alcohol dehydrogenase family)
MPNVAMITGGASGIGRAFGENLARRGMTVVLVDRQLELAEEVAAGIGERGGHAVAAELDVRDRAAFKALAQRIAAEHGTIDYLFNNAGIAVGRTMAEFEHADWDDVLDVNVRGVVHGVQAVYPIMIAQGSGHIINTGSIAGLMSMAGEGSYTAAKHAVVGLSKSLHIEGRRHGVRVSALCPGVIDTPILRGGKFGRINITGLTQEKLDRLLSKFQPMSPDTFAEKALARIFKNELIVIVPSWWRALYFFDRVAPTLSHTLWGSLFNRLMDELAEDAHAASGSETTGHTTHPGQ